MKKLTTFVLALVCILSMVSCSSRNAATANPVFETENIKSITLFGAVDYEDGIEVPSEYMDEVTAWIESFTIDEESEGQLDPTSSTFSIRIEYSDGTIVESGLNTITIDGATYYMEHDSVPECIKALVAVGPLTGGITYYSPD